MEPGGPFRGQKCQRETCSPVWESRLRALMVGCSQLLRARDWSQFGGCSQRSRRLSRRSLGGLVTISMPCAYVTPAASVLIVLIGGALVVLVSGASGTVALDLFALGIGCLQLAGLGRYSPNLWAWPPMTTGQPAQPARYSRQSGLPWGCVCGPRRGSAGWIWKNNGTSGIPSCCQGTLPVPALPIAAMVRNPSVSEACRQRWP